MHSYAPALSKIFHPSLILPVSSRILNELVPETKCGYCTPGATPEGKVQRGISVTVVHFAFFNSTSPKFGK